jgi:hypothetical protein
MFETYWTPSSCFVNAGAILHMMQPAAYNSATHSNPTMVPAGQTLSACMSCKTPATCVEAVAGNILMEVPAGFS